MKDQAKLWPELKKAGNIASPTPETLEAMAADFEQRFLATKLVFFKAPALKGKPIELAASYLRYSDENSNASSLAQQLQVQILKAKRESHFIPIDYVFGDAAVTGTTSYRIGYQGCLALLSAKEASVIALYIDEIGRASREAIDALRLGERIERNRQRLVGVSDGFDSHSPMAKMQLSIFGMLNQWFIDQLRSTGKAAKICITRATYQAIA